MSKNETRFLRSETLFSSRHLFSFHSFSGSSQTWLQVQQQRLRAKRAQRQKEVFDFTDGAARYGQTIQLHFHVGFISPSYRFRRSQTLSPVRNFNTLTSAREPKFEIIKRTTEQYATKPVTVNIYLCAFKAYQDFRLADLVCDKRLLRVKMFGGKSFITA